MITEKEWIDEFFNKQNPWIILTDRHSKTTIEVVHPDTFEKTDVKVGTYRVSEIDDSVRLKNNIIETVLPYVDGFMQGPVDQVYDDIRCEMTTICARSTYINSLEDIRELCLETSRFYLYAIIKTSKFTLDGELKTSYMLRYSDGS